MILRGLLFLFVSVWLGQCVDLKQTAGNDILQYLNSNSEQIYRYKNIKSLDILNQENDVYDVKTTIEVECVQDADSPCLTNLFNCEGKLQYKDQSKSFVVTTVSCSPDAVEELISEDEIAGSTNPEDIPTVISEDGITPFTPEDNITEITEDDIAVTIPEDITTKADISEIVLPREPCTGCPIDLDTNVEGVSILLNTALKHLETERDNIQSIVEVVRLQRQIVAGVLYILTVKVAPTTCRKDTLQVTETTCPVIADAPVEYCQVKYIEKVWISKDKSIISNNCTQSQEFTLSKELSTNTIDQDEDGKIKDTNDLPPERMDDMESQIIPDSTKPEIPKQDDKPPGADLSDGIKSFADSFFDNFGFPDVKEPKEQSIPAIIEEVITTQVPKADSSEESHEDNSKSEKSSEEDSREKVSVINKRAVLGTSEEPTTEITENNPPPQYPSNKTSKESSESSESSNTSEEKDKKRIKRNNNDNSSSSSSSSSDDDDDDNNNNNNNDNNGEKRKTGKECKTKKDDNNSSSSSSSSSDDDDDDDYCTNDNNRRTRSAELTDEKEEVLIRNLAEIAAATLDAKSTGNYKHVILDVESGEKTQLEGTIYNLKVKLAKSKCKRTDVDADYTNRNLLTSYSHKQDEECTKRIRDHSMKVCDVQIHLTDEYTSPKLLKLDCGRSKRQVGHIVGGTSNVSLDDPTVVQLAHNTVALYDGTTGHDNKYKVIEITWASKQVVSGMLHKFGMKVALSDCQKTESKPSKECNRLRGAEDSVCEVSVWSQPWLPEGIKTSINCENKDTQHFKSKRSLGIPGGVSNVSLDDPTVVQLAHNTVALYDGTTGHDNKYKVIEITWASQQVVSGTLHKFGMKVALSDCQKTDSKPSKDCAKLQGTADEICEVSVWSQPWLPEGIKTSINCENKDTQHFKSKRSLGVPGGVSNVSLDDPTVVQLAHNTVALYDGTTGHDNKYKVIEITWASEQVVSGTLHKFGMKVALSDCQKTDSKPSKDCAKLQGTADEICEVSVWSQPWLPEGIKTSINCENKNTQHFKSKRSLGIPGGTSNVSLDDPTVVQLAHNTVALYDGTTGHDNKYKVIEITWASQQVVSGMLHKFGMKVALSDCQKTDSKPSKDCAKLQGSADEICEVSVWSRPWLPDGIKTSVSCENKETQHFRKRRSSPLVGGVSEVSTDDPTILNLVEHALTQLDGDSDLSEKYIATEIVSAKQQVVAGVLYTIELKIAPSDCLKSEETARDQCNVGKEQSPTLCRVKIWDRPWLPNGRETNITCSEATYTYRTRRSVARPLGKDDLDVQLSIFRDFKDKYNKVYYSRKEEIGRFRIFRKNLAKIKVLNSEDRGTAVYGITKFSDLTYSEFRQKHMGLRSDLHEENEIPFPDAQIPDIDLPTEFDWRTKGVVTEVKDQQQCGSCWAFSVTGNVEGQYAIKHKKLVSLSEQELVDCDKTDEGCNGGLMDNAYRAIEQIGGLETESDYPYDAEDETCHYNSSMFKVELSGALNISQNEEDMAKWLVANGPISIAINANAMQFYVGGVSHPLKFLCSPNTLDHGVLIVGYGVHTYPLFKKTLPFWIVKNSWGTSWGEQGYYRVYRGDGTCGLNKTPSSAVVV